MFGVSWASAPRSSVIRNDTVTASAQSVNEPPRRTWATGVFAGLAGGCG